MFKPKKPTRPKKVGDTEDVDMDIEGNGSCLTVKNGQKWPNMIFNKNAEIFSFKILKY